MNWRDIIVLCFVITTYLDEIKFLTKKMPLKEDFDAMNGIRTRAV
jgi:hypothetical protein